MVFLPQTELTLQIRPWLNKKSTERYVGVLGVGGGRRGTLWLFNSATQQCHQGRKLLPFLLLVCVHPFTFGLTSRGAAVAPRPCPDMRMCKVEEASGVFPSSGRLPRETVPGASEQGTAPIHLRGHLWISQGGEVGKRGPAHDWMKLTPFYPWWERSSLISTRGFPEQSWLSLCMQKGRNWYLIDSVWDMGS